MIFRTFFGHALSTAALLLVVGACMRISSPPAIPRAGPSAPAGTGVSAEAFRAAEAALMRHDFPAAEAAFKEVLSMDTSTDRTAHPFHGR